MIYSSFHNSKLWLQYAYDRMRWRVFYKNSELAKASFFLNGESYNYYIHPYNHTWSNERAVEIPVVRQYLEANKAGRILELGNVTSHYIKPLHTIIDKYETDPLSGVINMDILDYNTECFYDLIISISTLEHVGWDEVPKDPSKALKALDKIKSLLSDSGLAVISIPVGYNQYVDKFIYSNQDYFDTIMATKRVSQDNRWEEVDLNVALQSKFNFPYTAANALLFVILKREDRCA
jgi:hypothetical protein